MIHEKLENMGSYEELHPLFKEAFDFIRDYLDNPLKPGTYELKGTDLFAKIFGYETRSEGKYEAHNDYIDIQYMIDGVEKVYYSDRETMEVETPYDPVEDAVLLKNAEKEETFLFCQGEVAIFFPEDAHKPSIKIANPEKVKKIVIKVRKN